MMVTTYDKLYNCLISHVANLCGVQYRDIVVTVPSVTFSWYCTLCYTVLLLYLL
jgi:hypothetical protein